MVRDADQMSFAAIEKEEFPELGLRARDGKGSPWPRDAGRHPSPSRTAASTARSCPRPSSTGPQSGILGMHKIQDRPRLVVGGQIVIRPMMYLGLSYDHRVVDGKGAVTFPRPGEGGAGGPEAVADGFDYDWVPIYGR